MTSEQKRDALLRSVTKPGRYTGGEFGQIVKPKEEVEMTVGSVYNVPVGVWHHIVVSEDASVLVVENADTTKDNTEKKKLCKEVN